MLSCINAMAVQRNNSNTIYPSISDLISFDKIPKDLGCFYNSITNVFDRTKYKNLYSNSNEYSMFYKLDLMIEPDKKQTTNIDSLDIKITNTNNPDSITDIHLQMSWICPIMKFIHNFSIEDFSFSNEEMFEILRTAVYIPTNKLIESIVDNIEDEFENYACISNIVEKINSKYSLSEADAVVLPAEGELEDMAQELVNNIEQAIKKRSNDMPDNADDVINSIYFNSSIPSFTENLEALSMDITGEPIKEYTKEIITPRIEANAKMPLSISLPRKWFTPLRGEMKCNIQLGECNVDYSSKKELLTIKSDESCLKPCLIGNTGIILSFDKAKAELNIKNEIIEMNIDSAKIKLPKNWLKEQEKNSFFKNDSQIVKVQTNEIHSFANSSTKETYKKISFFVGENIEICFDANNLNFEQGKIKDKNLSGTLHLYINRNNESLSRR